MVGWCCFAISESYFNTQPTFDDGVSEFTPSLTLLALEAALVNDVREFIDSLEFALLIPEGGKFPPE